MSEDNKCQFCWDEEATEILIDGETMQEVRVGNCVASQNWVIEATIQGLGEVIENDVEHFKIQKKGGDY